MSSQDLIDRRSLSAWKDACKKYEPLSPTKDAFVMSADGTTLVLRMVLRGEAEQHGMEGLDPLTAYAYANRLANMPAIEDAALLMQRDRAVLIKHMKALLGDLQTKDMPPDRVIAKAAAALREIENT